MLLCYEVNSSRPGINLSCFVQGPACNGSCLRPEIYWWIVWRGVSEQFVSVCQYWWQVRLMVCSWFPRERQKALLLHSRNLPIWSKPENSLDEIPFGLPGFQVFHAGICGSWSGRENESCPAHTKSRQDNRSLNLASLVPGCDRYSYTNAVAILYPFPVNCRLVSIVILGPVVLF